MTTPPPPSLTPSLRILACQIAIPGMTTETERDAHLELSARKISRKLEAEQVDIVVLPELSSLDYSRETFGNLDVLAEPLEGPSFRCWQSVARKYKCFVSFSFARRDGENVYIAIAVVDREGGLVGHYDKIHLAQYGASMEKEYFERGDHILTFHVNGFKIAPIICYDIRMPELSRLLTVDHHVDLILHCGAYYRDESFYSWHAFATARALENQVFFLSLNRAGENYGNSIFCWPWMDENTEPDGFPAYDESIEVIEITRTELENARENYSFLKDRLADYILLNSQ